MNVPENLPAGIYFYDSVILVKSENSIRILKAKCTHLGCKLNKAEDGIIICPCHGSRFFPDGKVLSGPADKDLQQLTYTINGNKELIIDETEFE